MLRRVCAGAVVALILGSTARVSAQSDPPAQDPPPLDNHELLKKYVWSTLGPAGVTNAALWSGFEEWRGAPEAWPRNADGFLERLASDYAASAIGSTTKYAIARLTHEDPSFVRCKCTGVRRRLQHALAAPFKARTMDGEWVVSPATVAGLAAENVIPAATWYPAPRGVRGGATHALTGVASKMAVDVLREFVPPRLLRKPE